MIKLQRVDGKAAQMAQGRVALAEVVDDDAHAAPAQVVELRHRRLNVARQRLLGDFERHGVGRQSGSPKKFVHVLHEVSPLDLVRR